MYKFLKTILLFSILCSVEHCLYAQKIIQYESGMGSRDPSNSNVWILYNHVKAVHEGMILYCDSATYDTKQDIFNAFRNVKMILTDTTTLMGDHAVYDGTTRVAVVSADTVRLIDGQTTLLSDNLQYDRNQNIATYINWGHTTHGSAVLDSKKGVYHNDTRDLFLYNQVVLRDSNSHLVTDTLHYNTRTELALFVSPTHIFSDSGTVYSEFGSFHTGTHQASSFKNSRVTHQDIQLFGDTLFYNDKSEFGQAFGNVHIFDSANAIACYGNYGVTDQTLHYSYVTHSAMVQYVDHGDSLFIHADTLWVFNNDSNDLDKILAYNGVRFYRSDVQGKCDSLVYLAADSLLTMFSAPVLWYEEYQLSADTIHLYMDSSGLRQASLRSNVFAIEKIDSLRFSQVKGRNADVYCSDNEPLYADILGSARMTYYVLDEDEDGNNKSIIGVNAGIGSDMRIYFDKRKPNRVVTYGNPDMKMYPLHQLPADERFLPGFAWLVNLRPLSKYDIFPSRVDLSIPTPNQIQSPDTLSPESADPK